jgi:thiol-disulfide isomerase/thioredoxin
MNIKAFFGKAIYVLPLVFLAANCNSQKQASTSQTDSTTSTVNKETKISDQSYQLTVPEISQKNPEGKILNLSSTAGNIVLVDFWASWCPPCRAANPELVQLYKNYNGKKYNGAKNFEIFSVSLDQDPEKWKAAILKDGLIWKNHVSDLRGWESAVARDYSVNSIPTSILLDEKGAILGQNMTAEEVAALLDSRIK